MSVPATAFLLSLLLFPSHGSSVKWVEATQGWEKEDDDGELTFAGLGLSAERWAVDPAAIEEEKRYHTSFQIITGAFQYYAVYMYMFVFAIQDNLLFRWVMLWHHSTLVLFTKLPHSYTVIKLNHISRKPLTKPNNSDVQLFEVQSLPSMDIVSPWNYGTQLGSHDLVQWGAFLTRRHTSHTLSKDSKDDTVHACHWCLYYI